MTSPGGLESACPRRARFTQRPHGLEVQEISLTRLFPQSDARLSALSASVDQLLQGAANDKNLSGELSGQLIQLKDVREARVASS